MPSGNSVAAWCLVRLAAMTGEEKWQKAADQQLAGFGPWFENRSVGVTFALSALLQAVCSTQELVCVIADEEEKRALAYKFGSFAHPQTSILVKTASDQERLACLAPFTADYPIPEHGITYYLCQNRRCDQPTDDFEAIRQKILGRNGGEI